MVSEDMIPMTGFVRGSDFYILNNIKHLSFFGAAPKKLKPSFGEQEPFRRKASRYLA